MTVEAKLNELGIKLPEPPQPVGAYVPAVTTGQLVFCSGQLCMVDGKLAYQGKLGTDLSIAEGYEAAKIAALNCLSYIRSEIGSLDRISRVVKVVGFVNSAPGFIQQAQVINGASELLGKVFGDQGRHARAAVSTNELPLNSPVEVEMIVEIRAGK